MGWLTEFSLSSLVFRFNTRLRFFTMGKKRKRNGRPPRPRKEGTSRTSLAIAAAETGGGTRTPVASQDPRPRQGRKRGGGMSTPPDGQEGGGAANWHAPKITITILNTFSAALAHGNIDASTPGKWGCVGRDQGAGAQRMTRHGPHA